MIADDNLLVREGIASLLSQAGTEVAAAAAPRNRGEATQSALWRRSARGVV